MESNKMKRGEIVRIHNTNLPNVHGREGIVVVVNADQARIRVMTDDGDKTCWFDYSEIILAK